MTTDDATAAAGDVASASSITTSSYDPITYRMSPSIIVIPWLHLMAVCLVVPLIAAGLAWVAVRRHPRITRRLA